MGFALHENLFHQWSRAEGYFRRFPVQVAILAPDAGSFESLVSEELFTALDDLTGPEVAFFSVLDPPESWLQRDWARDWWTRYQSSADSLGVDYREDLLVHELARRFGVAWDELPVIIVSTNLWDAEYAVVPTSECLIEDQFRALTAVARRGMPSRLHELTSELEDTTGQAVLRYGGGKGWRERLDRFYQTARLVTAPWQVRRRWVEERHDSALSQALGLLRTLRFQDGRYAASPHSERYERDTQVADAVLEEVAGELVPLAAVAASVSGRRGCAAAILRADELDDESRRMLSTALLVGGFLEEEQNRSPGIQYDFAPGAQGIWKAFEKEVNLSVMQAARAARGLCMPAFFARYDPQFPAERAKVHTLPNGQIKNINRASAAARPAGRHAFLTLGDALCVAAAMQVPPDQSEFDSVIHRCIGSSLPVGFMEAWSTVLRLRNEGSHTRPLTRDDFQTVQAAGLSSETLGTILDIKRHLSS